MRTLVTVAILTCAVATVSDGRPDAPKGTPVVRISGSIPDEKMLDKAPPHGVVVSAKGWDALAANWGIKEKSSSIDFSKTIFAVGTTRGSNLKVSAKVTDGDLKVSSISTPSTAAGFRYELVSVPREGVKTVNGQPLPKE